MHYCGDGGLRGGSFSRAVPYRCVRPFLWGWCWLGGGRAVQRGAHTWCMPPQIASAGKHRGVASTINGRGGVAELGISMGFVVLGGAHCPEQFVGFGVVVLGWGANGCIVVALGSELPFEDLRRCTILRGMTLRVRMQAEGVQIAGLSRAAHRVSTHAPCWARWRVSVRCTVTGLSRRTKLAWCGTCAVGLARICLVLWASTGEGRTATFGMAACCCCVCSCSAAPVPLSMVVLLLARQLNGRHLKHRGSHKNNHIGI